jgi:hypothetical protein
MNTHQCSRLYVKVGSQGVDQVLRPRNFRNLKWPHRISSFHSASRWQKDHNLQHWRPTSGSWMRAAVTQQKAIEREARYKSLPKFRYKESLSPRQFRLLELYRQPEDQAYPLESYSLEGTLYVASLDDKSIKYKALSYVWGDAAETESICIDGSVMKITTNCASALRRCLFTAPVIRIWVDSICINQGSDLVALTERGQQVAVMDEIYGLAVEVFVCLGQGNAATRAMFRSLWAVHAALVNIVQAITPDDQASMIGEYIKVVQEQTRKHNIPLGQCLRLTAMLAAELNLLDFTLQDMPWFKRAWVLQEVAVAKTATILCGENIMNFRDLGAILNFPAYIPRSQLSFQMLGLSELVRYHCMVSAHVEAIPEGGVVGQRKLRLQSIVMNALFRLTATRPEDKIYSLYGLCKRFGYHLPTPDYTRDLPDLDFEVARCFLQYDKSLRFLMMISGPASVANGLPSWVPYTRGTWQLSDSGLKVPTTSEASGDGCNASGTSTVDFQLHGKILRVKGRVFDYIAELGNMQELDIELDDKIQTMPAIALLECIENWWQILERARSLQYPRPMKNEPSLYHIDGQPFHQAAAELLTMSKLAAGEGRSVEQLEAIMSYFLFVRNKTRKSDPTERKTLVLPNEAEGRLHQVGSGYVLSDSIHSLLAEISAFCAWRAMGLSSKGYMAMFPYGSGIGDKIVVLHGTEGPVVIRPVDGAYQYVGSAYVQGIMNGEFWDKGVEADDTWFELV